MNVSLLQMGKPKHRVKSRGQGAMTLAHSLTNLVDFDTLWKQPFDLFMMVFFADVLL